MPVLSPEAYRRVTLLALASLMVIVVTGAAVRLTGSGLGCSDWPNCEQGRLAPAQIDDAPAMVEFTNRTITGIVSVAVAVAVLGSLARRPRRRDLVRLSLGLVGGVVAQIVLGGLVVLFDLSPKLVMLHFLLSIALVTNAVVLHHRASAADHEHPPPARPREAWLVMATAAVVVFTGTIVTAAGPHAGDDQAARLGVSLREAARLHGVSVFLLIGLTLLARRMFTRTGAADARRANTSLLAVIAAQATVGYIQYFNGVPALLVGIHICGALGVWVTALRQLLAAHQPARQLVAS
jgi:cytochrome c oxidase assembly protein subunit 15